MIGLSAAAHAETIMGLRMVAVGSWGLLGLQGVPALLRVVVADYRKHDITNASLTLLAVGLMIFQVRSLTGVVAPDTDDWTLIGLVSINLSAIGIFVSRAARAPIGHKRGAIVAHASTLLLLFLAGALS